MGGPPLSKRACTSSEVAVAGLAQISYVRQSALMETGGRCRHWPMVDRSSRRQSLPTGCTSAGALVLAALSTRWNGLTPPLEFGSCCNRCLNTVFWQRQLSCAGSYTHVEASRTGAPLRLGVLWSAMILGTTHGWNCLRWRRHGAAQRLSELMGVSTCAAALTETY